MGTITKHIILLCNSLIIVSRAMGVGKGEDDLDLVSEDSHLWVEEGREVSDAPWCDKMIS